MHRYAEYSHHRDDQETRVDAVHHEVRSSSEEPARRRSCGDEQRVLLSAAEGHRDIYQVCIDSPYCSAVASSYDVCCCEQDWRYHYYPDDIPPPPCPPAPSQSVVVYDGREMLEPRVRLASQSRSSSRSCSRRGLQSESEDDDDIIALGQMPGCRCSCDHLVNGNYRQLREVINKVFDNRYHDILCVSQVRIIINRMQ